MSHVPEPWEFALLALAAWRVWKLIGDDTILDRPRDRLFERLGGKASARGTYWGAFLYCPYCAGFWITLAWWGGWILWPHGVLVAAVPWAISAAVGLLGSVFYAISE